MKNDEFLFHLVQSMDKSEKRFFKLSTRLQEGEWHYLVIFDALEEMSEYDKSELEELLEKHQISQELAQVKKYLYDQILKSLRHYREKKSIQAKVKNQILDAGILEEKTLFKPALKRLQSARKLAEEHELSLELLAILRTEIRLNVQIRSDDLYEVVDRLIKDVRHVTQRLQEAKEYERIYYKLFVLSRIRDQNKEDLIPEIINDPQFQKAPTLKSFYGNYDYLRAKALNAYLMERKDEVMDFNRKVLELWKAYPKIRKEHTLKYKKSVSNYLNSCHLNKQYERFEELIKEITSLKSKSLDEEAETFQLVVQLNLLHYLNTQQFDKGTELVSYIETGLKKYRRKINPARKINLYYNLFLLFFAQNNYNVAEEWLKKILDMPRAVQPRLDLRRASMIFQIILNLELNNDRLLDDYLIPATKRLQKKSSHFSPLQHECLNGLYKIVKYKFDPNKKKDLSPYENLLNKLITESQEAGKGFRGMNVIQIWLESKLTNTEFKKIMISY